MTDAIEHAAQLIGQADALVIGAGAGMGVDSGLPDFRGTDGFWNAYPALARSAISFSEIASPLAFRMEPRLAWGFYGHRLALYRSTVPHEGFEILKRWAGQMPLGAFVFTSNVDGQFQIAGFDAERIEEHHGSIHRLQCTGRCGRAPWPADSVVPTVDTEACQWVGELPSCPACGALARPNLLMFGDGEWQGDEFEHQATRMRQWLRSVHRPVVVELGAGTAIPSVRYFSERVICDHGGRLVRINPREATVPTPFDVGLPMSSVQALRLIDAVVEFA
ncbi:MAG: NAD-dependent deacetylase [Vitreoscilla sp.]|nr:NAD-dependent deacetylase [Vitreoscilla sp.]